MEKGADESFQRGVAALQEGTEEVVVGHTDRNRSCSGEPGVIARWFLGGVRQCVLCEFSRCGVHRCVLSFVKRNRFE